MPLHPEDASAVVVVESMFGNTRAIADTVAEVLGASFARVDVLDVADAPLVLDGVGLLVVGAPTHAFGLSRPSTRQSARQQGSTASADRGLREWLDELERPAEPIPAAAFDTRIRTPFPTGSAARGVRRRLRRCGFDVLPVASFVVGSTSGPLLDGELARARRWAATLDVRIRPTASRS